MDAQPSSGTPSVTGGEAAACVVVHDRDYPAVCEPGVLYTASRRTCGRDRGGASQWLQCVLLSEQRLRAQLAREIDPRRLATDPQTGQVDEGRLAKLKGLERSDLQLLALADWSFTPVKVSLVLHEVLALCGLALSFLTQSRASIVPFVVAALMLDLPLFPRLDNMLRRAGRLMSHYSSGNGQKRPPQRDDFVTKI